MILPLNKRAPYYERASEEGVNLRNKRVVSVCSGADVCSWGESQAGTCHVLLLNHPWPELATYSMLLITNKPTPACMHVCVEGRATQDRSDLGVERRDESI